MKFLYQTWIKTNIDFEKISDGGNTLFCMKPKRNDILDEWDILTTLMARWKNLLSRINFI